MTDQTSDQTLGTDPWGGEETLFDRSMWRDRTDAYGEAITKMDEAFARLDNTVFGEVGRMKEVKRRLEQRIYELEAELDESKAANAQAADRLDRLVSEIKHWKTNEQ